MEEDDSMTQGCCFLLFYSSDLNYFCSGCLLYLAPESHLPMQFICRMLEEQQNYRALWKVFWCQRPLDAALRWQRDSDYTNLFWLISFKQPLFKGDIGPSEDAGAFCVVQRNHRDRRHCNSWFYLFFKDMATVVAHHPFLWLLQAQHPAA